MTNNASLAGEFERVLRGGVEASTPLRDSAREGDFPNSVPASPAMSVTDHEQSVEVGIRGEG